MNDLRRLIGPVAKRLLGEANKRLSKRMDQLRFGRRGSLAIDLSAGTWFDHENGTGGGVLDLVRRERKCDEDRAIAWLRAEGLVNGEDFGGHVSAMYDYVDENGALLFQVLRYEPKDFKQRRPDGGGGWIWKLDATRRVLYRLPELIEGVALGRVVLIPEGEKDVDRLRALGLVATCNSGGANKWRDDAQYNAPLRGANVVLIPDNDDTGWKHINQVGQILSGIAAHVRVLRLPSHKDVSEWLEAGGGTGEQLEQLIKDAPDWVRPAVDIGTADKSKATEEEDRLIAALAAMPPGVERARQRRQIAKQLGVRQSDVEDEVTARQAGGTRTAPLHAHWIVEPWPEVADGDALLRDIIRRIRRHIVISHEDALAIALWVMLCWVHDEVATHSPILNIMSAEPESGKTTTLGLVSFLMPRSIVSVEISEAALYRSIKLFQPSFCIDEFDQVLASDDKAALRGVINSGHARGQGVVRCVGRDEKTPELFTTFCAKAIGMVGQKLPPTTKGRCIIVELRRRKPTELVERFAHKDDAELAQLRSRLLRWSMDNEDALRGVEPLMPPDLDNRRADNWRLQFAIADLAGGDWGDQARATGLRLEGKADKRTIGSRLLADIKTVFDADGGHCMHSAVLLAELVKDPERPWVEFTHGKPLTQGRLARLLGHYGIISQSVRPPDLKTGRGYYRAQFEDAWERYLPASSSATEAKPGTDGG